MGVDDVGGLTSDVPVATIDGFESLDLPGRVVAFNVIVDENTSVLLLGRVLLDVSADGDSISSMNTGALALGVEVPTVEGATEAVLRNNTGVAEIGSKMRTDTIDDGCLAVHSSEQGEDETEGLDLFDLALQEAVRVVDKEPAVGEGRGEVCGLLHSRAARLGGDTLDIHRRVDIAEDLPNKKGCEGCDETQNDFSNEG